MFTVVTITAALATMRHLLESRPDLRLIVVNDLREYLWIIDENIVYIDGQQPDIATSIYDAAMHLITQQGSNIVPLLPAHSATG